jgi:hypothetical protein
MRRDGINIHDSLWLFTAVSTYGTTGSSYFDVELYKTASLIIRRQGCSPLPDRMPGIRNGFFDASGNLIQTGDMILAVNFTPGSAPVVDVPSVPPPVSPCSQIFFLNRGRQIRSPPI